MRKQNTDAERNKIAKEVFDAIGRCLAASGREVKQISGDQCPLTSVPGFDSLCGVEVTVDLERRLNIQIEDNIFIKVVRGPRLVRSMRFAKSWLLPHAKEGVMGGAKSDDLPGIGARLRQARESAGLSQAQAAKLMGLHRPAITEMENETRKVSAGELRDFARHYKVSVEWLTGEPLSKTGRLKIAARKLSALRDEDLKTVMRIVDSMRRELKTTKAE